MIILPVQREVLVTKTQGKGKVCCLLVCLVIEIKQPMVPTPSNPHNGQSDTLVCWWKQTTNAKRIYYSDDLENSASGCAHVFVKCGKRTGLSILRETLHSLQQVYLFEVNRQVCLSNRNPAFGALHHTIDNHFRQLLFEGAGTTRKQAKLVSHDEEEELRAKGFFSISSPLGFLRAILGLSFVLRRGEEHHQLQLHFHTVPGPLQSIDTVEYREHGSNNRPGGHHQKWCNM